MRTAILFALSFFAGYYAFLLFSHPEKKKHHVPKISFKNIELLPNFRIHWRSKTYHFHHWFLLTLLVACGVFIYEGMLKSAIFNGVTAGGILQGLRYKDRFRFRLPRFREKNK